MSISEKEASECYESMYQYDLREAYVRGRSAPPTNAEIEAVAKRLCYLSMPTSTTFIRSIVTKEEAEENTWNNTKMCNAQDKWLDMARDLLEIARKAVSE